MSPKYVALSLVHTSLVDSVSPIPYIPHRLHLWLPVFLCRFHLTDSLHSISLINYRHHLSDSLQSLQTPSLWFPTIPIDTISLIPYSPQSLWFNTVPIDTISVIPYSPQSLWFNTVPIDTISLIQYSPQSLWFNTVPIDTISTIPYSPQSLWFNTVPIDTILPDSIQSSVSLI